MLFQTWLSLVHWKRMGTTVHITCALYSKSEVIHLCHPLKYCLTTVISVHVYKKGNWDILLLFCPFAFHIRNILFFKKLWVWEDMRMNFHFGVNYCFNNVACLAGKNVCKQCKHAQVAPHNARHNDQVFGLQDAHFRCRLYIMLALNHSHLSSTTILQVISC